MYTPWSGLPISKVSPLYELWGIVESDQHLGESCKDLRLIPFIIISYLEVTYPGKIDWVVLITSIEDNATFVAPALREHFNGSVYTNPLIESCFDRLQAFEDALPHIRRSISETGFHRLRHFPGSSTSKPPSVSQSIAQCSWGVLGLKSTLDFS
ncbi:hypothetical protein V6N13_114739 [Hibiscus sabdariffa]